MGKVESIKTSAIQNADAVILAKPGKYCGYRIVAGGTEDAHIIVYDDAAAASGDELDNISLTNTKGFEGEIFAQDVAASKGIFVDLTGTASEYIIYFKPSQSDM